MKILWMAFRVPLACMQALSCMYGGGFPPLMAVPPVPQNLAVEGQRMRQLSVECSFGRLP